MNIKSWRPRRRLILAAFLFLLFEVGLFTGVGLATDWLHAFLFSQPFKLGATLVFSPMGFFMGILYFILKVKN